HTSSHSIYCYLSSFFLFFFFIDTPTTEIYTLSLHDALPILQGAALPSCVRVVDSAVHTARVEAERIGYAELGPLSCLGVQREQRSEEHTSELQSRSDLVCRLLLEKKKKKHIHFNRLHTRHDN